MLLERRCIKPAVAGAGRPRSSGASTASSDLEGPAIFAANHHSHLDTPAAAHARIPEPWRHQMFVGAAADYFFGNRVTSAALGPGHRRHPDRAHQGQPPRRADQAAELIDDGWSMLIFPEGGRSPDGWGQPFRGGAAYLVAALRRARSCPSTSRAPAGSCGKGKNATPSPRRTTRHLRPPAWPADEGESQHAFADRIEAAVAALADEATTDWWPARQRVHAGTTPSLTGPDAPTWRRAWALGDDARAGPANGQALAQGRLRPPRA